MQQFCLLIFLLVYFNLLYMFLATNSPIFRSTFDCIYSFGTVQCTSIAADRWQGWGSISTGRQQYRRIVPKAVYTVKSTPEDGRVCHPKHIQQIQIDQ